jgi:hypothetical protein
VTVSIEYVGGYGINKEEEKFNNTQDAQSYLQVRKCYNKEERHQ